MSADNGCDVVIPIWDNLELTNRCLESLSKHPMEGMRLVLIDNASQPPTASFLRSFQSSARLPVALIRNDENLGFVRASNQGIQAGHSPWVCLLNNDTVVTDGWLAEMIRVARSDPRLGLVNPTSNSLGFPPEGGSPERMAQRLQVQAGRWVELPTVLGFCLLAQRSLLTKVGGLDESFGMGNFDDDDLSRRVRQAGLLCVRACGAYVYHEEKASFRNLPNWKKDFDANRRRFETRWGRRLRILWGPLPPLSSAAPDATLIQELSRQGHWLFLIGSKGAFPNSISRLAQVSFWSVHPVLWRPQATLKLLWKRKKPFDLVVSCDPRWSAWLRGLQRILGFELLEGATSEKISRTCQRLCQSPSGPSLMETRPLPAAISLPLSVVVITKNEALRLPACLDSVPFAGEIVVVDDFSTDSTLDVARRYTDRVIQRKMEVEGRHRNFAHTQARFEWILSLDADEQVTPELARELWDLFSQGPRFDLYSIPRRNHIGSRWIRFGGWYPSTQVKLFKRSHFQWEETTVHPRAITDRPCGTLHSDILHYSYRSLEDFLEKLNRQTTLEAQKWILDGRPMGLGKALWRMVDRFWRTYIGKKGYQDGLWGVIVAGMASLYQFLSFAKFWHTKSSRQDDGLLV